MGQNTQSNGSRERIIFIFVFLAVTGVLAGVSYGVILYINAAVRADETAAPDMNELSPIYVNFYTDAEEYVSAESYLAMGNYAQENPIPQNVQVLEGLTTHEINGYMLNHFVAGLRVNCTYCHNLNNFAAEEWGDDPETNAAEHNRWVARQHLRMSADLNQNWLTMLPGLTDEKVPTGSQITCATCHNGAAQFNTYPEESRETLPADFVVPLDEDIVYSVEEQGYLNVNGRTDVSLDATQLNQYVMYHMNASMNVGCTHCHNSRYFPSYEVPAKYYSMQMLQMTQYIQNNWSQYMVVGPDDTEPADPSCSMCHWGAVIPGGAARNVNVLAPTLVEEGSQDPDVAWGYLDPAEVGDWLEEAAELREGNMDDMGDDAYDYDPTNPENTGFDPEAEESASNTEASNVN